MRRASENEGGGAQKRGMGVHPCLIQSSQRNDGHLTGAFRLRHMKRASGHMGINLDVAFDFEQGEGHPAPQLHSYLLAASSP